MLQISQNINGNMWNHVSGFFYIIAIVVCGITALGLDPKQPRLGKGRAGFKVKGGVRPVVARVRGHKVGVSLAGGQAGWVDDLTRSLSTNSILTLLCYFKRGA